MSSFVRGALIALAVLGFAALLVGMYGLVIGDRHYATLTGVGAALVSVWALVGRRLDRTNPHAR